MSKIGKWGRAAGSAPDHATAARTSRISARSSVTAWRRNRPKVAASPGDPEPEIVIDDTTPERVSGQPTRRSRAIRTGPCSAALRVLLPPVTGHLQDAGPDGGLVFGVGDNARAKTWTDDLPQISFSCCDLPEGGEWMTQEEAASSPGIGPIHLNALTRITHRIGLVRTTGKDLAVTRASVEAEKHWRATAPRRRRALRRLKDTVLVLKAPIEARLPGADRAIRFTCQSIKIACQRSPPAARC